MTRKDLYKLVEERLGLIKATLSAKGTEYAKSENAFHNFEEATGLSFHTSREMVAWEYSVKHLQSIKDILKHVSTDEYNGYPDEAMIREKFGDAIVYFILMESMLLEKAREYELKKKYEQNESSY